MLLSKSDASSVARKKNLIRVFWDVFYMEECDWYQIITDKVMSFVKVLLIAINYFKQLAWLTLIYVAIVFPKSNVTQLL